MFPTDAVEASTDRVGVVGMLVADRLGWPTLTYTVDLTVGGSIRAEQPALHHRAPPIHCPARWSSA